MKYLLDTSIFLWMIARPEGLNAKAHRLLSAAKSELYLSAASSWEIVIKAALGRLELDEPPARFIPKWQSAYGIRPLSISARHALAVWDLPRHHQDPFDRMILAQTQMEQMVLLTSDRALTQYPVDSIWCGK